MGYFGKIDEKETVIKLRSKGLSYKQIQSKVKVSKDTISRWCRDVVLTQKQLEKLLKRKLKGGEKGRLIAAKVKRDKRIEETKKFLSDGIKEVGKLSKRDRFVTGISLYAGEGGKKSVEFANSDPKIVNFMMKWFREFCKVSESKYRGAIWIHDDLNEKQAKIFWSDLTKIPIGQFYKSYKVKSKTASRKVRKNIHQYGVFSIRITDIKLHRKIMGWVSGILGRVLV